VIRIDSLWLAVEPMDMRAGAERLLARVVPVFGSAQAGVPDRLEDKRQSRTKKEVWLVRLNVALVHRCTTHAVVCSFKAIPTKRV